jgi:hypothetical protein
MLESDAAGDGARREEVELQGIDLEAPARDELRPAEDLAARPFHRQGGAQEDEQRRRGDEEHDGSEAE